MAVAASYIITCVRIGTPYVSQSDSINKPCVGQSDSMNAVRLIHLALFSNCDMFVCLSIGYNIKA